MGFYIMYLIIWVKVKQGLDHMSLDFVSLDFVRLDFACGHLLKRSTLIIKTNFNLKKFNCILLIIQLRANSSSYHPKLVSHLFYLYSLQTNLIIYQKTYNCYKTVKKILIFNDQN